MQQHAREMMACGVQAENLTIQHVGERRERVPVLRMDMSEGPLGSINRDPAAHHGIGVDVGVVVVVNEFVAGCLTEHYPCDCDQENADGQR